LTYKFIVETNVATTRRRLAARSRPGISTEGAMAGGTRGARAAIGAIALAALAGTCAAAEFAYAATTDEFVNPERGLYVARQMRDSQSFSGLRAQGLSLVYGEIHLPEFRAMPISAARLGEIDRAFDRVRAEGLKAVVRITYNHAIGDPDASLATATAHLQQLEPYFEKHKDVVAFFQAGIIGAWGEWHSSSNGLETLANRNAVIDALLQRTPDGSFIQMRTPGYKWDYTGGATVLPSEAFTSAAIARLGHHNDCYLASADDYGTYPSGNIELWKNRVAYDGQYVPVGGETCALSDFTNCAFALPDVERLRWTYLHRDYNTDVLDELGPCFPEIRRRLGYRFELIEASLPDAAVAGDAFQFDIAVRNVGFAPPYKPRNASLVFLSGNTLLEEHPLPSVDARRWLPDDPIMFSGSVIPAGPFAVGAVDVALRLADPASALDDDVRYMVRFANVGTWNATTGTNKLATLPVGTLDGCGAAIAIDGAFADWQGIAASATDATGDHGAASVDYMDFFGTNDCDNLYLRVRAASPYAFATGNHWGIFFDTDMNAATGYAFGGTMGSEFLLQGTSLFDQRGGGFNEGEQAVAVAMAPTGAAGEIEFAIPLAATFDNGAPLLPAPGSTIRARFYSDTAAFQTTETMPDGGPVDIPIVPAGPQPIVLETKATPGGSILQPAESSVEVDENEVVSLVAQADAGYAFAGWTGRGQGNVEARRAASTSIAMTESARLRAVFSPQAGNLLENGYFDSGTTGWTPWTGSGSIASTVEGAETELRLSGALAHGGLAQRVATGGAGRVVTATGYWRGDAVAAGQIAAEVWAINSARTLANGESLADGANDAVLLWRRSDSAGWDGAIGETATTTYRGGFVAAEAEATILVRLSANTPASASVFVDNLEVRSVAPPGTRDAPPPGFAMRKGELPITGVARMAEHPVTGRIYAAEDVANDANGPRIYRIDPAVEPMDPSVAVRIGTLGLAFGASANNWASGIAFDDDGNMYVSSQNGYLLKGTWNPQTDGFAWSSFLTLALVPSIGNHGVGGIAIDDANGWMYINSGAIVHGTGNVNPEPDLPNGLNTRILRVGLDGTGLAPFCRGIRNNFGIALRADGSLFGLDNSTDCPTADELNLLEAGNHYGHPFVFASDRSGSDDVSDLSASGFTCQQTPLPPNDYAAAFANYGPDAKPAQGERGYLDGGAFFGFDPNSAPTGIDFYEPSRMKPGATLFPEEYRGRAFVARFGRQIPSIPDVGYDVLTLRLDEALGGFTCNTFMQGLARPVDVLVASTGKVYILEYSDGTTGANVGTGTATLIEIAPLAEASGSMWEVR